MTIRGRTEAIGPSARDLWPRRAPGLPPGQRRMPSFPRFGAMPGTPRPPPSEVALVVCEGGVEVVTLTAADLATLTPVDAVHDLHCVTTWSRLGVRWRGVAMTEVWERLVRPRLAAWDRVGYVVARGADGYRAALHLEDLLHPDVLLATGLDGAPLDARHGAPLRLVSPAQYGYKSVKHLSGLDLREEQPATWPLEHPRGRVAGEERHARVPGRLLRWPYRALIIPTARKAERSAGR